MQSKEKILNVFSGGCMTALMNILTVNSTGGPLITRFFETLEKQPCKQKTV